MGQREPEPDDRKRDEEHQPLDGMGARSAEVPDDQRGDGNDERQLRALGDRLHAHIRHEERMLFPLIEATLPDHELAPLALALEQAHEQHD